MMTGSRGSAAPRLSPRARRRAPSVRNSARFVAPGIPASFQSTTARNSAKPAQRSVPGVALASSGTSPRTIAAKSIPQKVSIAISTRASDWRRMYSPSSVL